MTTATAWEEVKKPTVVLEEDKSVREVWWEGNTDFDLLKQVRSDIDSARRNKDVKTLRVTLMSPGGPVVMIMETARLVRAASDSGLVVEIHARGVIASGGTFLLAAGTPGKRFITKETLVLVHGIQYQGSCYAFVKDPKTEEAKAVNAILNILRDLYVRLTTQPQSLVEKWLTCGEEQVGDGQLAVDLKLADAVEK